MNAIWQVLLALLAVVGLLARKENEPAVARTFRLGVALCVAGLLAVVAMCGVLATRRENL